MVVLDLNKKMGTVQDEDEDEEVEHENALLGTVPIKKTKKSGDPNPGARNHVLLVTVYYAEGIDPPSMWPEVQCRNYRVILWVNSSDQYVTKEVRGFPSIIWDEKFHIRLSDVDTEESNFLYLEVIRVRSRCDPGPSTGVVVVGRARVPLPKMLRIKQSERVGLARLVEGKVVGEGHIMISMKVVEVNEQWHQDF